MVDATHGQWVPRNFEGCFLPERATRHVQVRILLGPLRVVGIPRAQKTVAAPERGRERAPSISTCWCDAQSTLPLGV